MAVDNNYKSGAWWIICDSCSKKTKSDDAKKRWDGFLVCPSCFEMRHPQDFVKTKQDKITVPIIRPRPPDIGIFSVGAFDTLSWADSLIISRLRALALTDTLSWLDPILISKSVTLDDAWSLSESLLFNSTRLLTDTLTLSESLEKQLIRGLSDSLTYAEVLDIFKSITLTDAHTFSDSGSIALPIYAYDYFAEDYTQTTQTF